MFGKFQRAIRLLIGHWYQTQCLECDFPAEGELFCKACFPFPRCEMPFEMGTAAYWLTPAALRWIHHVKFGGWIELIEEIKPLILSLPSFEDRSAVLIPVPLSQERLWKRGFNQAEILAHLLSKAVDAPLLTGGLLKSKETLPQSLLGKKERKVNLAAAFRWNDKCAPPKKAVLVDDIFTTGETLKVAKACLERAGVSEVRAWTMFRAMGRV